MKFTPLFIATSLAESSRSTFSFMGTVKALICMGVFQLTVPYPFCGASLTGSVSNLALTLAICTAVFVAFTMLSVSILSVAAKPQLPLAITRIPMPYDSVLLMLSTLASRVTINCRR